jgi:hypothetical protein
MPLLDISLVTQTLINLVTQHITLSPEFGNVSPLNVSALPFDKLTGDHTIGLYLYHVVEDGQSKNPGPLSSDVPPVAYNPMGLRLHYQLMTHSDIKNDPGTLNEQLMFGLALKAFHEYSSIDQNTQINGTTIFPTALQGVEDKFYIDLRPIQADQAMNYWSAGSQPMRIAAYYEVSVVYLEPRETSSRTGRVLMYGVYSFARGAPHLDGSKSTVTFRLPDETTDRSVDVQPAEAPVSGTITLFGSELSNDQTTLILNNKNFVVPIEVGPADWGVSATEDQITAVIQTNAGLTVVLPGIYSASAKVVARRKMPDGTLRDFPQTSNAVPFLVTPRVDNISLPVAGVITVTGTTFQDAALDAKQVQVYLSSAQLNPGNVLALNPGEFGTTNSTTLLFRFPATGFNSGEFVPFRLLINGVESAPKWVRVP